MEILMGLLFSAMFAVAAALLASRRGRSVAGWAVLGLLIGPFALLLLIILPRNEARLEQSQLSQGSMKKCPYCAELIKREAVVCRFCGKSQGGGGSSDASVELNAATVSNASTVSRRPLELSKIPYAPLLVAVFSVGIYSLLYKLFDLRIQLWVVKHGEYDFTQTMRNFYVGKSAFVGVLCGALLALLFKRSRHQDLLAFWVGKYVLGYLFFVIFEMSHFVSAERSVWLVAGQYTYAPFISWPSWTFWACSAISFYLCAHLVKRRGLRD